MYFILLKMFLLHTASLKNTATTNLFLAANLHPERDQRRLAVLKTTGFAMNRDASTADIRTANPLKWGRCLIWSLFNFRWVGVQHPPTTQFLHPNTKGWTILWKNKPEKWKKRIPFFPDIAVENGPFEDLVPNGSRKKKTSKKTLDHKTRHILGWIDLTRSFPSSRPQELFDRITRQIFPQQL